MPLTPNFSVAQTIGLPSIISITDSSTGSDAAIFERVVYIVDALGNYITAVGSFTTPTYTVWDYADATISIDCLIADLAPNIRIDWLDNTGAVLYTKTVLYAFTLYGLMGSFALTQDLSANPQIMQDAQYWQNRCILRCNIDDADLAVQIGANIFIAQAALERSNIMLANQSKYF